MSLILLEGMDKVGKSTVAQHFVDNGYEYIHMSSPPKYISREDYLALMFTIVANTANKNVVIDRTWYGELVWPYAYGRTPLLFDHEVKLIDNMCETLHNGIVQKIYMHDDNVDGHKYRMLKFKEPSYNYDLVWNLYNSKMIEYNFKFLTFPEAEAIGWISKKD